MIRIRIQNADLDPGININIILRVSPCFSPEIKAYSLPRSTLDPDLILDWIRIHMKLMWIQNTDPGEGEVTILDGEGEMVSATFQNKINKFINDMQSR